MRRRIWAADVVGDTSSVFDPSMTEHQGTDIGGSGGNGKLDSSTTLGGERKDKRQPIPRSVCNGHERGKKVVVSNERQLCITFLIVHVCILTIRRPITTGK